MNPETTMSLDDAVAEVLALLTGMDLTYDPSLDRYRTIARQLNRAMRSMALEKEWSHYSDVQSVGTAAEGVRQYRLRSTVRPRIVSDDAVRLVNRDGVPLVWAYFLPRDALHKYAHRPGLWASVTNNVLEFSRPTVMGEAGLDIQMPVMREPRMFRLPEPAAEGDSVVVPAAVRNQPIDFPYPDVVILRAAFYVAQSDPVMQPRVQTLEAQYKDLMYQIIERDDRNTDSPYINDFVLPLQGGLRPEIAVHGHPHSDVRYN